MIQITHFVNPNMFFFKWKSDDGFDKHLHDMEIKIHGTVGKKSQSDEKDDEIQINDIVAVFHTCWNRWIRGQIKEIYRNGLLHVWAVDYGMPMVSKPSQVVKLQQFYAKANMKTPRIRLGGLMNCVPAEIVYDFERDANELVEMANWSKKAMEITQKAIDRAVRLKFDEIKVENLMNRQHHFGHLKCQKPDGSWVDLDKCLSNACVAKITTENWSSCIQRFEFVRQSEWKSFDGTPLHSKSVILPIDIDQFVIDNEESDAQVETDPVPNKDEAKEEVKGNFNGNHSSQPLIQFDNTNNMLSLPLPQPNPSQFMKQNYDGAIRNNRRFHSPRTRNQWQQFDPSTSYELLGWHGYGNKLNNPRYREEVKFFESSFRKPSTPIQNDESSSSSEGSPNKPEEKETTEPITTIDEGDSNAKDEHDSKSEETTKIEANPNQQESESNGTVNNIEPKKVDNEITKEMNPRKSDTNDNSEKKMSK